MDVLERAGLSPLALQPIQLAKMVAQDQVSDMSKYYHLVFMHCAAIQMQN
jgi:hypothetical protein